MRAGDVAHIPRGYWHQATRTNCGEGYSLHVTFGFVKRTGVDWLTWIADRSREHQLFRHDLDRWGSHAQQSIQQQALVQKVSRLLADYPTEVYLAAREQERPPTRHVATRGVFGPPTAVVCVADFPPRIEQHQDTFDVLTTGKKITFAGRALPAVRRLLTGHPVHLTAVTAATGIDANLVAETLLKEGVCAELTEALSSGCTGLIPTETCSSTP